MNGSLFGAANKLKNSSSLSTGEESKGDIKDQGISAYLNENSPTQIIQNIPILKFKQNHI